MPNDVSLRLQRFRQLPLLSRETWQGAIVRLPAWIEGEAGEEPFRAWAAIWVSAGTGRVGMKAEPRRDAHGPELLFDALLDFAQQQRKALNGRASRLHVADRATRDALEHALGEPEVSIEVVPTLDEVEHVVQAYTEHETRDEPPAMTEVSGVTADLVRGFAEAAAAFYRAEPWQHLSPDDLLLIESNVPSPSLRYAVVLGTMGLERGIGFHADPRDHEEMANAADAEELRLPPSGAASVLFEGPDGIPFADHDLWTEHDLPLAGPLAYPFPARYFRDEDTGAVGEGARVERLGRDELVFIEALFRALAETTEDEIDSGRWTKKVIAGGRATDVKLALPGLLEEIARLEPQAGQSDRPAPLDLERELGRFRATHTFEDPDEARLAFADYLRKGPAALTPLEQASELCYEAGESTGRSRIVLAKRALALSPDCAEAYLILAESGDPERALALYEQGIAAARRAIGDQFDELVGRFWDRLETRPYMRARMERADLLAQTGRVDEAIADYQELLRLNPNDNQGARDPLVGLLLQSGRDEDAGRLLERYADDVGAVLMYARLLWEFRRGDSAAARAALAGALKRNPFVPRYLLDLEAAEDLEVELYQFGSEEEAVVCVNEIGDAWQQTPGALDWLREQTRQHRKDQKAKKKSRDKRRPRRR